VLTALIILSEAGTIFAGEGNANLRILNISCNIFGFAVSPVIPIILIAIIDLKLFKTNRLIMLPSFVNILATALSPWFGFVFYVDVNNHYERGEYFLIFVAAYLINLIILLVNTVKKAEEYNYPIKAKTIALSLFVVAGTSIQLLFPYVNSSWHSITFSLFLYYFMLSDFDGSFDTLTRLYNRAAYEKATNKLDSRNPYSVIVIDINNFKGINDTYGHDFGDAVLKKVTSVIRKSFNKGCSCYRVGGDEFHIISRETDPKILESQLKDMTNNLEKERRNDSRLPTVSYGYGIFRSEKMTSFKDVNKEADDQMYYFKKTQKNMLRKN
jgi:diguanylate cyclase (GGDEF)-like protein